MKTAILWLPRVLAILYILFISIFALDAFDMPQWYLALFMHLIPSFILIAITLVAWRRPFVGGILFVIAGLVAILFFHTTIFIPLLAIGLLFWAQIYLKGKKTII